MIGLGPVGLGGASHSVSSNTARIAHRSSRNSNGMTLEEMEDEAREQELNDAVNEEMTKELFNVFIFMLGFMGTLGALCLILAGINWLIGIL